MSWVANENFTLARKHGIFTKCIRLPDLKINGVNEPTLRYYHFGWGSWNLRNLLFLTVIIHYLCLIVATLLWWVRKQPIFLITNLLYILFMTPAPIGVLLHNFLLILTSAISIILIATIYLIIIIITIINDRSTVGGSPWSFLGINAFIFLWYCFCTLYILASCYMCRTHRAITRLKTYKFSQEESNNNVSVWEHSGEYIPED